MSSGTVRNLESSCVSIPPLLIEKVGKTGEKTFVWRTDLKSTKPYWEEWFKGLTNSFLGIKLPKVLILAGNERMDTPLTIAQMQGKFRLEVISEVGHVIQEDKPESFAKCAHEFLSKFSILEKAKEHKQITSMSGKIVTISN